MVFRGLVLNFFWTLYFQTPVIYFPLIFVYFPRTYICALNDPPSVVAKISADGQYDKRGVLGGLYYNHHHQELDHIESCGHRSEGLVR